MYNIYEAQVLFERSGARINQIMNYVDSKNSFRIQKLITCIHENALMVLSGFFLRKMLGTRYGQIGTRFLWFQGLDDNFFF